MMSYLTIALFVLPLLGAITAFFPMREGRDTILPYSFFTMGGLVALAISGISLYASTSGNATPVPGALAFLSALFIGFVGLGVALVSPYAIGYLARYRTAYPLKWIALAYALFVIGMEAVILAPTVLYFLLAWELMSVSAYFLVIADGEAASLRAGLMYLVMTQFGFLAIASGMMILAGGQPFVPLAGLAVGALTLSPAAKAIAFVLLLVGFGSKAGLVPLHQWLPYAHPQAPSHASALLSGVMLKVALFGFIQSLAFFGGLPLWAGITLIVLGLLSAFFGALHAVVEDDLKRLLAWSSIENMGLIFSALGVAITLAALPVFPMQQILFSGALLFVFVHSFNHLLFKSSLFMVAGSIVSGVHTRSLDALGGLAKKWPAFAGVVLALAFGAAALPPFGTFFGEWAYIQALAVGFTSPWPVAAGAALMLGVIGLVGGLAAFAFVKLFSATFLGRARTSAADHAEPLPRLLVIPPALGAVLLLVSGPVFFPFIARVATTGVSATTIGTVTLAPSASISALLTLALVFGMLLILALFIRSRRTAVRVTGTWDCGTPLTPRMEMTATGFAASIRFFFRSFVIAQKQIVATPVVATNPWIATKRLSWSVASFWERVFYEPIVRLVSGGTGLVRRLQGGIVQFYLLLMLVALVTVLFIVL